MKYTIEKNLRRQDSVDGVQPLDTAYADSLPQARALMLEFAEGGQFYAAVFIGTDRECVVETDDVDVAS